MSIDQSAENSLQKLKRLSSTTNKLKFERMVKNFERPSIIVEGDSWFDYPPKAIVAGAPSNILKWIEKKTKGKVNILCLQSNGDEMTGMMSGEQRHILTSLLDKYQKMGKPINVLLYSGGGNDVVGKWDLERFLNVYKPGFTAKQCVDMKKLKNKTKQIELAYLELFAIRNQYSPDTDIITHTYDIPFASGKGAKFLGKKFGKGWLKPAMENAGIPAELRREVCQVLMETLRDSLQALQSRPSANGQFKVTETQGTLNSKSHWLNEIHPTSGGFKLIAAKVYKTLRQSITGLPNWT